MHIFDLQFHPDIFLSGHLSLTVWLLILLALIFDFLNGLHDAANSVATVVSTQVLTPRSAVFWAAFFNFMAFVVFPTNVAGTIAKDVIQQSVIDNQVIAATLLAACGWNLLTWYLGLPTSSSHALIGGMVGAGIVKTGGSACLVWGGLGWIMLFIVLAPLVGAALGTTIAVAVIWICRRLAPWRVDKIFRRAQLLSAALFSLGHGGNDAQKTMGIILVLLVTAAGTGPDKKFSLEEPHPAQPAVVGHVSTPVPEKSTITPAEGTEHETPTESKAKARLIVPLEVVLACHLAMGLGTMCGGWRIVKTMGQRIIRLRPVDGFCAESAAATVLAMTTFIKGIPISTTHTITGSIMGVGVLKRWSAVRWAVAGRVVWAWILTIPGSALLAALCWSLLSWGR